MSTSKTHLNHNQAAANGDAYGSTCLRDVAAQLQRMMGDDDWWPVCHDEGTTQKLLERLAADPAAGDVMIPKGVASLVAAFADFCRFRKNMAARLNAPDDRPFHVTPDEWLRMRLHQYGDAIEGLRPYALYRLEGDRFHVNA